MNSEQEYGNYGALDRDNSAWREQQLAYAEAQLKEGRLEINNLPLTLRNLVDTAQVSFAEAEDVIRRNNLDLLSDEESIMGFIKEQRIDIALKFTSANTHFFTHGVLDPCFLPGGLKLLWEDTKLEITDREIIDAWNAGFVSTQLARKYILAKRERTRINVQVASAVDATLNESL